MKLSELKRKTVTGEYLGEPFSLEVRASVVTPSLVSELSSWELPTTNAADTKVRMQELSVKLCSLVAAWDIEGDNGIIPLEPEAVYNEVPVDLQTLCIQVATGSVGEAKAPPVKSANSSGGISSLTAPLEPSHKTTHSSGRRNISA